MIGSSFGQQLAQYQTSFLVEEKILASATTSVTFSNLDIIRDGGYEIEITGVNNNPANTLWYCYVNGDTTLSNYHSVWVGQSNNSAGTASWTTVAEPCRAFATGVGTRVFSKFEILFCPSTGLTTFFSKTRTMYTTSTTNSGWTGYHEHRVAQANINTLTIISDQDNGMGAGTIIRLYRKLNGNTATFIPLQSNLVADILVPTAVAQVNITGLDGNLHGGYEIDFMAISGATSAQHVKLFYNGDTNTANYTSHMLYGASTTPGANSSNPAFFASPSPTIGQSACYRANIILAGGKIGLTGNGYDRYPESVTFGTEYTASNLTSMSFVSATANALGAGSRIRVYRRK